MNLQRLIRVLKPMFPVTRGDLMLAKCSVFIATSLDGLLQGLMGLLIGL